MPEEYAKIVRIGISRYYGFVDASFIEIEWVYGNGKPAKILGKPQKHEFLGAYRHSDIGVEYAKFCGIHKESDLYKLAGKKVNYTFDVVEDGRDVIGLGRPSEFTKDGNAQLDSNRNKFFYIPYYVNDTDEEDWDAKFVIANSN